MKKTLGNLLLAFGILLGVALVAFPASVTQLAGLAVAQTATQWNSVKDMAFGDSVASGSMMQTPCLWNGVTCDRQRGSITTGALTNPYQLTAPAVLADATANPTLTQVQTFPSVMNATTWDRLKAALSDSQAATGIQATASMLWNQASASYDRNRGGLAPIQLGTLLNSTTTSAANAVNTVTVTGAASTRVHVYRIGAYCSAGTATLTIQDGATTIFTSPAGGIGTLPFLNGNIPVVAAYTATTGNNMVISLTACGAANTSTLNIQADRF